MDWYKTRDLDVVKSFRLGEPIHSIADRYSLADNIVIQILRKNGVSIKQGERWCIINKKEGDIWS